MAIEERLELDISEALRGIDTIDAALLRATQSFKVGLAEALDLLGTVQVEQVDASAVTSAITEAVGAADTETTVEADASAVTVAVDEAVDEADTDLTLEATADAVTAAVDDAIVQRTPRWWWRGTPPPWPRPSWRPLRAQTPP